MGMDKYGCFMQMYVYYYWNHTIVNSMKTKHVLKVIGVFQRTCSCLKDSWKKEMPGSHYYSFFALSNLLTQTCSNFHRTGQLFWTCKMYIYYLPLCPHTVFWFCSTGDSQKINKILAHIWREKVAKEVYTVAKLATLHLHFSYYGLDHGSNRKYALR